MLGAPLSPLRALIPLLPAAIQKDRVMKAIGLPLAQRYATIPNLFDRATHAGLFSDAMLHQQRTHIADYAAHFFDQCDAKDYIE